MEEYQECAGNLKALVLGLKDDVRRGIVSEREALNKLAAVHRRAFTAQAEFRRTIQRTREMLAGGFHA